MIQTDKTAKMSFLSSGNVSKYAFLNSKDVIPEQILARKAVPLTRFDYSSLGKELKTQTSIANKQYQNLDNTQSLIK